MSSTLLSKYKRNQSETNSSLSENGEFHEEYEWISDDEFDFESKN